MLGGREHQSVDLDAPDRSRRDRRAGHRRRADSVRRRRRSLPGRDHGRGVSPPDMAVDLAWPRSAATGLNMYATRPRAFSEQDQMMAILLSNLGAVVSTRPGSSREWFTESVCRR